MAINYAKKHGTKVIFDIDYREYNWRSKADIAVYYSLVGRMSDVIIGSREEFNLTEYLPEENDVADYEIAEKYDETESIQTERNV
jgi:5-dehydro-2-deoxygluconokinase